MKSKAPIIYLLLHACMIGLSPTKLNKSFYLGIIFGFLLGLWNDKVVSAYEHNIQVLSEDIITLTTVSNERNVKVKQSLEDFDTRYKKVIKERDDAFRARDAAKSEVIGLL